MNDILDYRIGPYSIFCILIYVVYPVLFYAALGAFLYARLIG